VKRPFKANDLLGSLDRRHAGPGNEPTRGLVGCIEAEDERRLGGKRVPLPTASASLQEAPQQRRSASLLLL
jgi:hypothetical protein